jgi:hypothetical protein
MHLILAVVLALLSELNAMQQSKSLEQLMHFSNEEIYFSAYIEVVKEIKNPSLLTNKKIKDVINETTFSNEEKGRLLNLVDNDRKTINSFFSTIFFRLTSDQNIVIKDHADILNEAKECYLDVTRGQDRSRPPVKPFNVTKEQKKEILDSIRSFDQNHYNEFNLENEDSFIRYFANILKLCQDI